MIGKNLSLFKTERERLHQHTRHFKEFLHDLIQMRPVREKGLTTFNSPHRIKGALREKPPPEPLMLPRLAVTGCRLKLITQKSGGANIHLLEASGKCPDTEVHTGQGSHSSHLIAGTDIPKEQWMVRADTPAPRSQLALCGYNMQGEKLFNMTVKLIFQESLQTIGS